MGAPARNGKSICPPAAEAEATASVATFAASTRPTPPDADAALAAALAASFGVLPLAACSSATLGGCRTTCSTTQW